jgi:hypothetical protein
MVSQAQENEQHRLGDIQMTSNDMSLYDILERFSAQVKRKELLLGDPAED